MLRIDESAKTLVAPEAAELVPAEAPERDELNALISSGWDAFAAEIGLSHVKAVAPAPAPGIDLLAVDTNDGRAVIVTVAEGSAADAMGQMLASSAAVAEWDGDRLGAMHQALKDGANAKHVIVGAQFDGGSVTVMDWLAARDIVVAGFAVECLRRGGERMMNVVATYPAEAPVPAPEFVAQVETSSSAPPPPPPVAPAPEASEAEVPAPPAAA